jgi:hypothetical protein
VQQVSGMDVRVVVLIEMELARLLPKRSRI